MKRLLGGAIITLLILGGWSPAVQAQGGKTLLEKIDAVEDLVDQKEWKQADKGISVLQKMYRKQKWKIQLLGDEGEYESIDKDLARLKAAAQTKDQTQAKVELSSIRATLKAVYSF